MHMSLTEVGYYHHPNMHTYIMCSHYKIVVVRRSVVTDTRTEVPDNLLLPAGQTQTPYYATAAITVEDFQPTFPIGDGQSYMFGTETFVNVPLNVDQEYMAFIRLYSSLDVS